MVYKLGVVSELHSKTTPEQATETQKRLDPVITQVCSMFDWIYA